MPTIPPPDECAADLTRRRLDQLAKPPGSLGVLEALAIQLAGAQRRSPPQIRRPLVIVFAADHGVAREEAVSPYPPEVTAHMLGVLVARGAAVSLLADEAGAELELVDAGVAGAPEQLACVAGVRFVSAPVSRTGTGNIAVRDAMTPAELERALAVGAAAAGRAVRRGTDIAAVGEIGIGNTTSAAALVASLLGRPAEQVTGPGTGLDPAGVARKIAVVERALIRADRPRQPRAALAALGGFEIAAMTGFILEASRCSLPVLVDGFVAGAAALVAAGIDPGVRPYLVAATRSPEPGHAAVLDALALGPPLLDLGLRLGEASGAALAIALARASTRLVTCMQTLDPLPPR